MTLQERMYKALGMPKRHIPQRAVKSHLARNFCADGNLFIDRFDQIRTCGLMGNRNFRAKTIVDLAMSIECSLKSLIISLSKDDETPAGAYKSARVKGHKLDALFDEVTTRASRRLKMPKKSELVFSDLKLLGVGARYSYEIWLLRFQSESVSLFLGRDLISRTVDDVEWTKKVRNEAVQLNQVASKAQSRFMSNHSILSGSRLTAYKREMEQFIQDATR